MGFGHELLSLLLGRLAKAKVLSTPTQRQALAPLVLYTASVFRIPPYATKIKVAECYREGFSRASRRTVVLLGLGTRPYRNGTFGRAGSLTPRACGVAFPRPTVSSRARPALESLARLKQFSRSYAHMKKTPFGVFFFICA